MVRWRGQEEILVGRIGQARQPVGQPYDYLLAAPCEAFARASRINDDAERPSMRL